MNIENLKKKNEELKSISGIDSSVADILINQNNAIYDELKKAVFVEAHVKRWSQYVKPYLRG